MLDSFINLPKSIPSLWRSLSAGKKRRVVPSKFCSLHVEDLEQRQLLSAANGREHGGTPRIINGTTTASFTAVGQLTYTPTVGTVAKSTGTLIAPQWVLTSASASKGLNLSGGTASVILGGVTYTVDSIVTYPKYNASSIDFKQDIALWHLSTAVPGTITPQQISYTKPTVGNTMTIVGFGLTGTGTTGAGGTYGTKQTATSKVQAVTPSLLTYKLDNNSEGITATGDVGGPLMFTQGGVMKIFGIVSGHSTTTSKIGTTAYNTRVDLYGGWIDDTLSQAHPEVTTVDDYVNTADTVGSTNRLFNLSTTTTSFTVKGKLAQYGDIDVFKVITAADGFATLTLSNTLASSQLLDTKLEILASNGTTVLFTSDDNSATDLTSKLNVSLAAGTYFVRVSTYGNYGKGDYQLVMTDVMDNVGDTTITAKTLTGTKQNVFASPIVINSTTDVDYFKITLTKNGDYQFDCTYTRGGTFDPVVTVYNSLGVQIDTNDDFVTGGKDSRVKITSLTAGTVLYVKISGASSTTGNGNMTIRKL